MDKFNRTKYNSDYIKNHYIQFKVNLKPNEDEELNQLLKHMSEKLEKEYTRTQFLRDSIKQLKNNIETIKEIEKDK